MAKQKSSQARILLLPFLDSKPHLRPKVTFADFRNPSRKKVKDLSTISKQSSLFSEISSAFQYVISGTYADDPERLRLACQELESLGCSILFPNTINVGPSPDAFIYITEEQKGWSGAFDAKRLDAIRRARFVWLHAPDGYISPTAALEIGFARASGVPVFSENLVSENNLRSFIEIVKSPAEAIDSLQTQFQFIQNPRRIIPTFNVGEPQLARTTTTVPEGILRVGSAGVIRQDDKILLGLRDKEPNRGRWILPGGKIELFESIEAALKREIEEETGLVVQVEDQIGMFEIIHPPREHRIIVYSWAHPIGGELQASSDVSMLRYFDREEINNLDITPIVRMVLAKIGWI